MTDNNVYDELIKFQVGDYVIDEFIGAGGQAVVYRAHAIGYEDRNYALKIFGLIVTRTTAFEVGLKEAQKLAAIEHNSVVRFHLPNIAEVDFNGEKREILYLPMDYANRGNCEDNPPFLDKLLSVRDLESIKELLDGLQAVHRKQIIHYDIKPANILQFEEMVDGEPRIILRISDFGIAKVNSAFSPGVVEPTGATPIYMSPEQLDHKHKEAGDVYSMGATLYYMLTGKEPIEPVNVPRSDPISLFETWQKAHQTQPRPNATKNSVYCPARLALLIIRMMSINPRDRPTLDECKIQLRKIIDAHDLRLLQRLPIPEDLKAELDRDEFPIRYVPKDFNDIFKSRVHILCGQDLFIIRIKMGHPVYTQYKEAITHIINRFSDCFCFYETWGTYDVNILLWGKSDKIKSLKKDLERRLARSKVQIRLASKITDLHCDDSSIPADADPVYALAIQEDKTIPGLDRAKYLCKDFPDDVPDASVRAFTYVEPVDIGIDSFIRNAIIRNVHDKLTELMKERNFAPDGTRRFYRMSLIDLSPESDPLSSGNDGAVLLVSFVASRYRFLSDVPTEIISAVGENAVKTSTFLETRRVVIQSDKILFEA
jgi:serine/threonine protein kinase